uniref:Uncharacterized protein n=1 Tax=Molossus molossus TaxID=27622 RepID=A0A7J8DTH1_MOLMO|nr:hypothetical protein HJG59_009204 [Molossus molossus]
MSQVPVAPLASGTFSTSGHQPTLGLLSGSLQAEGGIFTNTLLNWVGFQPFLGSSKPVCLKGAFLTCARGSRGRGAWLKSDSQAWLRTSWPGLPASEAPGAELPGGAPTNTEAQRAGLLGDHVLGQNLGKITGWQKITPTFLKNLL